MTDGRERKSEFLLDSSKSEGKHRSEGEVRVHLKFEGGKERQLRVRESGEVEKEMETHIGSRDSNLD